MQASPTSHGSHSPPHIPSHKSGSYVLLSVIVFDASLLFKSDTVAQNNPSWFISTMLLRLCVLVALQIPVLFVVVPHLNVSLHPLCVS